MGECANGEVYFQGRSGKHALAARISEFDPKATSRIWATLLSVRARAGMLRRAYTSRGRDSEAAIGRLLESAL